MSSDKTKHFGGKRLCIVTSGLLRSMADDAEWFGELLLPASLHSDPKLCDAVLCWGNKPSAQRAGSFAKKNGLSLVRMEDAFLRSVYFGAEERPLGVVMDNLGIYYDSSRPSRLECLIANHLSDADKERAHSICSMWRAGRVSKYNHALEYSGGLPKEYVLVVDQTAGDLSLIHGQGTANTFQKMLDAALEEYPSTQIVLKTHPEVMAGRKRGHFDLDKLRALSRVILLGEDVHPVRLLENARAVYTVTSQMGFEALIWGKKVRTFGMPFYAGWGLTVDDTPAPDRRQRATLEQLVHAALVTYPRYVHPETKKRCEVEDIIEHLALQRAHIERWPRQISAIHISRWKKPHMRRFFPYSKVRFRSCPTTSKTDEALAIWSCRGERTLPASTRPIVLEDGFIRSVGLGCEFAPPLSWIADFSGIYFDSSKASDLEKILQETVFSPELLARAAALWSRILEQGVTKYNVGKAGWTRPEKSHGKRLILVPGQVESDASIEFGSPVVRSNYDLLEKVRKRCPQAYLIYKPHPDVVAGRRSFGQHEKDCRNLADDMVTDVSMNRLLDEVDEVHTMTSLTGFEALLRSKIVTTYGQPFYASWGLTEDMLPLARRNRKLSIDELVAGALILYPVYTSRITGRYTTPERALDELAAWENLPKTQRRLTEKIRGGIADLLRCLRLFL
jgi:capsular polysaccharide export protein